MKQAPDIPGAIRCAARTQEVNEPVLRACERHLAPAFPSGLALLAVGGYGRRELFPHSDVDLLLLTASEKIAAEGRDAISGFVQDLWDGGLRVSHSVRTVEECCTANAGNRELSISLLDERLLAGDEELHERLRVSWARFLRSDRETIARDLVSLTRTRHAKYHDTIYHLEPNIKDTPGGLRDLHVVHWLVRLGMEAREPALDPEWEFLAGLRWRLHEWAGRDNNVLSFETQDELSGHPAELMRSYFRHARTVSRAALRMMESVEERGSSLLAAFRDWRSRLSNADFTVLRERVYFRSPSQLASDADLAPRLFLFVARHGVRLAADTERRIEEHSGQARNTMTAAVRWPFWEELLSLPHAAMALRAMHDSGALARMLPEWRAIECLVVRDFYHRYTVDEHTLVAIEALDNISDARFDDLRNEAGELAVLRLALLLHDTGKGSGHHVQESLRHAEAVIQRTGMPVEEAATLRFLIERHLELSAAMSGRDLTDRATARALAEQAETIENLKLLTLETYADIGAVYPGAMSAWRLEQLWRAYRITQDELTRELASERIHAPESRPPAEAEFLEGFPTRYLRTHDAGELRRHLELAEESRARGAAVEVIRGHGAWRLTLVTGDHPFLFASAAGALAGFGLNILKAEAFGNKQGLVLDTFTFSDPLRTLELNPSEVDRLGETVKRVILGKENLETLLRARPKAAPPSHRSRIHPSVSFDNDASANSTLIEIVAQDRPGLLYDLSRTISSAGCEIEVVLIDTQAHKALDVFYVTFQRAKLPPQIQVRLHQDLLRACSE